MGPRMGGCPTINGRRSAFLLAEVGCPGGGLLVWRAAVTGLSEPGYNGGDGRGVVMQRWRCPMEVVPNGGGGQWRWWAGSLWGTTERSRKAVGQGLLL